MQQQELKSLVESGLYKPDPSRVAVAMLRRRGVRDLLVGVSPAFNGAGQSRGASEPPRQAA
jgi:hypothetical protein